MNKKYRLIGIGLSACGIIGFCLLIVATVMDDAFPNPLRFVAMICLSVYATGHLINLLRICKQKKSDTEDSKSV